MPLPNDDLHAAFARRQFTPHGRLGGLAPDPGREAALAELRILAPRLFDLARRMAAAIDPANNPTTPELRTLAREAKARLA